MLFRTYSNFVLTFNKTNSLQAEAASELEMQQSADEAEEEGDALEGDDEPETEAPAEEVES
jgi:hypothetical protein